MTTQSSRTTRPAAWTWYVAGAVAAVTVGYVAAAVNGAGWAPVGLASLGVGVVLGLALAALAAVTRTYGRRQLVVGAAVLALTTVVATHIWLYRGFCDNWHAVRDQSPQLAMFRPETPWTPSEYLAHELSAGRATLWAVDAVLVVAAAVGTVAVWRRHAMAAGAEQAPLLNDLTPDP